MSEITYGTGNVFRDLDLPDPETLLLKAELVRQISKAIETLGLNQTEAAQRMGTDQPKVSNLLRGRTSGFSVERLLEFLLALGYEVVIQVRPSTRQELRTVRVEVEEPVPA